MDSAGGDVVFWVALVKQALRLWLVCRKKNSWLRPTPQFRCRQTPTAVRQSLCVNAWQRCPLGTGARISSYFRVCAIDDMACILMSHRYASPSKSSASKYVPPAPSSTLFTSRDRPPSVTFLPNLASSLKAVSRCSRTQQRGKAVHGPSNLLG